MEANNEGNLVSGNAVNVETQESGFSLSRHAAAGAMVSCFLSIFWIFYYLQNTITSIMGESIMSFVLGQNYNMEELASEALFVVITRFLLGFSLSWLPVTAIIAAIRK